jgi:hypothetical protein
MAEPEYTISDMRVQTVPGFDFFYVGVETTMAELSNAIAQGMPKLFAARDKGHVWMRGSVVFIYRGMSSDAPLSLEMGFPCPPGTQPVDDAQVRRVDEFPCASLIYTGRLEHISLAYDKLLASMREAGLTPGNEGRELYLHFDDAASPNNVTMIQLGIQGNG